MIGQLPGVTEDALTRRGYGKKSLHVFYRKFTAKEPNGERRSAVVIGTAMAKNPATFQQRGSNWSYSTHIARVRIWAERRSREREGRGCQRH